MSYFNITSPTNDNIDENFIEEKRLTTDIPILYTRRVQKDLE